LNPLSRQVQTSLLNTDIFARADSEKAALPEIIAPSCEPAPGAAYVPQE